MKIAIAGAGALGGRFGLYLHQAGNSITFIDRWEANIEAIRKNGLQADLDGKHVVADIPIYTPEEVAKNNEHFDLIIALTKAPQLESMFDALKPIIDDNTHILCLMNGLGHEDVLCKYVPMERISLGVTMWTAGMKGPGFLHLIGNGYIQIENLRPEGKEFTLEVIDIFEKAGLCPEYSKNVRYSIWRKACINGVVNACCTVLECNMAELGALKTFDPMMRTIISEFALVAHEEGVDLDQEELHEALVKACEPTEIGRHYPSMYQDLINNHRYTEIDYIDGACARKAKQYGVETPYCKLLTELVHSKEELLIK